MYRFLKYSIVCILSCMLPGCQEKYERIVLPVDIVGELTQDDVSENGGTFYLTLTYNGNVTVKNSADWCKGEYLSGESVNNIKITVEPNNGKLRSGQVSILTFSNPAITVTMNQAGAPPQIVGNWQFRNPGSFGTATAGSDLELSGSGFFEVPGIHSSETAVEVQKGSYFVARHGLAAVGGAKVNNYTILYDFQLPAATRACFLQTDMANKDDVDIFLRGNMYELGIGGVYCNLQTTQFQSIKANMWYRLVICAKLGESLRYYLNGVEVYTHDGTGTAAADSRLAFDPAGVLLFADEDGEDEPIRVAQVTIWEDSLKAAAVIALGQPGDPVR